MNAWLWWLAQNTMTAAVVIPLVIAMCRLFRNRPAVQHLLWLVVLLKFLTPNVVVWPWTANELRDAITGTPEVAPVTVAPISKVAADVPPMAIPEDSAVDSLPRRLDPSSDVVRAAAPAVESAAAAGPALTTEDDQQVKWISIALRVTAGVSLLGAVFSAFFQLRRIVRHAPLIRNGTNAPKELTAAIKVSADRLGVKPPRAVVARGIPSPFLWCLGCLRLVWPESMANERDVARSRGVIAHELAHVRRCDHWVAWLELAGGVVWWWNPLFWLVRRRLRETAEMACDALAVGTNPEGRREYAEMLLELSAGFPTAMPKPAVAVSAGAASIERRLSMILSDRVSGKLSSWGIFTVLGFALVAAPGWSLAQQTDNPDETSIEAGPGPDEIEDANSPLRATWRQRLAVKPKVFPEQVFCVAVSPDGKIVASGEMNGLRLVDAKTGADKATLRLPEPQYKPGLGYQPEMSVAFSPDGETIATGHMGGYLVLWDVRSATVKTQLKGHSSSVGSVAFSPDGKILASAAETVRFWDVQSGKEVPPAIKTEAGHGIYALAFSPDGRKLAFTEEFVVRVVDVTAGNTLLTLNGPGEPIFAMAVAYSPDGKRIALGTGTGVTTWDAETGQRQRAFYCPTAGCNSLAFSPDGKMLASGGGIRNENVWLNDVTGDVLADAYVTLRGHTKDVRALAFARDGSFLATVGDDGLRLWVPEAPAATNGEQPQGNGQRKARPRNSSRLDEAVPFEDYTGRLMAGVDILRISPLPPKPLAFRFDMDERSYLRYQRLLNARKVKGPGEPLAVGLSDEDDFPREAVLHHIEGEFDPDTGTIGVYGVLSNVDGLLLPGMFVRVRMRFTEAQDTEVGKREGGKQQEPQGKTKGTDGTVSAVPPPDIVVAAGESVQEAIDKAPEGATIRLAAGAFEESIMITKSLTLQGAGWEKTTIGLDSTVPLSQQQKDDFFAALESKSDRQERAKIGVTLTNRLAPPALTIENAKGVVLRGIRFRGPTRDDLRDILTSESLVLFVHATGSMRECAIVGPFMNGVTILDGSDVQIEKSLVAAMWGAGVAAGPGTKLRMSDSDIRNCYHRCVTLATDQAAIERCRISGSAWHGIRYDNCSPRILNNHIFGNARSGIYASGRTSARVVGNVFWRNEMDGMSCWFDNLDTIEQNTIIGNLREGIAVVGGSKPTISRNIFARNPIAVLCSKVAPTGQPLAEAPSGNPQLEANFFFENPGQVQDGEIAKPFPPGNHSADPMIAGAGGNFRLAADSPARPANAGAADPIAFVSPFPIQPEETSIIPDTETRDESQWKKSARVPN